jgi:hypothetical protein
MKTLAAFRKAVQRFQLEVVGPAAVGDRVDLHINGVFLDKDAAGYRVVVLVHAESDLRAVEAVARQYFEGLPYKVKVDEVKPEASLDAGSALLDTTGGFGTLGGFFKRQGFGDTVFGISNNHVLAGCNALPVGTAVCDVRGNVIGKLADFIMLQPPPIINAIDLALFELNPGQGGVWRPGVPQGKCTERIGLKVCKLGANDANGPTYGTITGIGGTVNVKMLGRVFSFGQVIAIKGMDGRFSNYGDSGALVFTPQGYLVGLLFAIMGEYSYAAPFRVMEALGLLFPAEANNAQ